MILKLTGDNEPTGLFRDFYGRPTENITLLREQGYNLISVAEGIKRHKSAPADVINGWRENCIFTGDGIAYNSQRKAKIVLDAILLCEVNQKSQYQYGALVLSDNQWEDLSGNTVLELSAEELLQVYGKGFRSSRGLWYPENKIVEKTWIHLSRGKDLQDYAEMVSSESDKDR